MSQVEVKLNSEEIKPMALAIMVMPAYLSWSVSIGQLINSQA